MNGTTLTIVVALITSGTAAFIGWGASRQVNRADAADKLVNGAVKLVEQVQEENASMRAEVLSLRGEVRAARDEARNARRETEACERRHDQIIEALRDRGIDLGLA